MAAAAARELDAQQARALRGVVAPADELTRPLTEARDNGNALLSEEEVLASEAAVLQERHETLQRMYGTDFGRRGIALAVSGGGIRSAAVACGVLWSLASQDALKYLDHISSVSGGGFAGAAYLSDLARASPPGDRPGDLDLFHAQTLANTVLRMQANANWLVGLRTWADRLLTMGVIPVMIVSTPLIWLLVLLIPLAFWIELEAGSSLRSIACQPTPELAAEAWRISLGRSWQLPTCLVCLGVLLPMGVAKWCGVSRFLLRRAAAPKFSLWQGWKALHQLCSRTMAVAATLLTVKVLALALQQREFGVVALPTGSPTARLALRCACDAFLGSAWDQSCDARIGTFPPMPPGDRALCADVLAPEAYAEDTGTFVVVVLLWVAAVTVVLACALGALAVTSYVVAAVGPAALVYVIARIAQWRIFAPITGQSLRGLGSGLSMAFHHGTAWMRLHVVATGSALLLLPFLWRCGSIGRLYFTRRLVRAFFRDARDLPFHSATSVYAPLVTFGCTVSDFHHPREHVHFAPFAINALHAGSAKTGYVRTASSMLLGHALGISSAAIDPAGDLLLTTKPDKVSTRFWLTALGLALGDWLPFGPSRSHRQPLLRAAGQLSEAVVLSAILAVLLGLDLFDPPVDSFDADTHAKRTHLQCVCRNVAMTVVGCVVSAYWVLSFFAGFRHLRWVQHGYVMRQIRSLLLIVQSSPAPPPYLRVSDGGLSENTGLLQLLIRRQRWIIALDASHDPQGKLLGFRTAIRTALAERICSFYDVTCPERDIEVRRSAFARLCPALGHAHLMVPWPDPRSFSPPSLPKSGTLCILASAGDGRRRMPLVTTASSSSSRLDFPGPEACPYRPP